MNKKLSKKTISIPQQVAAPKVFKVDPFPAPSNPTILDGLRKKVFLDRYAWRNEEGNPLEEYPEQMWSRVAKTIASVEKTTSLKKIWEEKFYDILSGFKFLPGGRILSGAGTGYEVTFFNCFVLPDPEDSRGGIIDNLKMMTEVFSRAGGAGVNISSLRPRGARVKKVSGTSSGPVNWANLYSVASHDVIQQGGCFTADTRIMTQRGLVKIEEIINSKNSYLAVTHQGFKNITARFNNGQKEVLEVETAGGYKVKVTKEHKFVTFDNNGSFCLTPLSQLKVGDNIVLLPGSFLDDLPEIILSKKLPKLSKFSYGRKQVCLPYTLNADLAFILGVYMSDGSRIKDDYAFAKGLRFSVDAKRTKDLNLLIGKLKTVFGVEPISKNGDGAVINVYIYSRTIVEFFELNNLLKENSSRVFVPEQIFTSPSSVVKAFIGGVFFGDGGNRGGKGGFRISSVNKKFLEDISLLLLNIGIASKINTEKRDKWQNLHTLSVNGHKYMAKFLEMIKLYSEKAYDHPISKRNGFYNFPINILERFVYLSGIQRTMAYSNPTTSAYTLSFIGDRMDQLSRADISDAQILVSTITDKIKAIIKIGIEPIYDLEVADVHLLSGNGFYTSNSRRGALMLMLNDWHPDIEEFATVKRDTTKLVGANLSICFSDKFMEAVEKGNDWDLKFPDTKYSEYDKEWDGDLAAWEAKGYPIIVYKTIKAADLWNTICESAWMCAEPGIHFLERSNKWSNNWYWEKLIATNPSLRAGTKVLTQEGIFPIEKLEGKLFKVKNLDGQWSVAKCFLSGRNKPLYKVTLHNREEIFATAEHKWPVQLVGGGLGKVDTTQLRAGNILPFPKAENISFDCKNRLSRDSGFMLGWLYGDGWITERKEDPDQLNNSTYYQTAVSYMEDGRVNFNTQTPNLSLRAHLHKQYKKHAYGFLFSQVDKSLAKVVLREVNKLKKDPSSLCKQNDRTYLIQTTSSDFAKSLSEIFKVDKKENGLPTSVWQSGQDFIHGFVDGLFSSDGFVAGNAQRVQLTTKHQQIAKDVSDLLSFFGIKSAIGTSITSKVSFPNCKNYHKTYRRYDVRIDGYNAVNFAKIFTLSHPQKQSKLSELKRHLPTRRPPDLEAMRITSVEKTDLTEDVWDVSVFDETHCFYINHCITGNCGEQPLPAWGVCNLGSVNLSAFVDETGEFNYSLLTDVVSTATRMLDNVIDANFYFYPENKTHQSNARRVGLGTMGLGDALIKMKVRYGSPKSLEIIEKIYQTIRNTSYETSSELAKEKGAFPKFDKEKYLKGYFISKLPESIKEKIAKNGIRNSLLLTQAPTGSTSLLAGTSSGIEPVFDFAMVRRDRIGEHIIYHPLFQAWKEVHPEGTHQPDYFACANDLTPDDHIKVQALIQSYTDSSISKTVNAPNSHTIEDVKKLYMDAYKLGCKGITYMRDGSRDGVLTHVDEKSQEQKEQPKEEVSAELAIFHRPMVMPGRTYKMLTPIGEVFITVNRDQQNLPVEVFITIGKAGMQIGADAEAIGRLISLTLRLAGGKRQEIAYKVVSQLKGIGGASHIGFGKERVMSLADAVAKVIAEDLSHLESIPPETLPLNISENGVVENNGQLKMGDLCPECGNATFVFEEGCKKCHSCGYSIC